MTKAPLLARGLLSFVLFVSSTALITLGAAPASASPLPPPVQRLMSRYHIPDRSLGLYVREVNASRPLLLLNPTRPYNPASVMKVLTTWIALDELGPAHTWDTEAYTEGRLARGRLDGDLILKGGGDPFLVTESFWKFLHALRNRGVRVINGDVIVDNSYFHVAADDPGAFDGRPYRSYNAIPDALLLNFATTDFLLRPDDASGRVVVVPDPPAATLSIHNELKLTRGPCNGANYRVRMNVDRAAAGTTVTFAGDYPSSCGDFEFGRAVLDDFPYLAGAFESMWREMGGKLLGKVRQGTLPAGARLLYRQESKPLADLIRDINKWSNNVMTRTLLLSLGAARFGAPGTVEKGAQAVDDYLRAHGISAKGLVIANGAGLSRDGRVSAATLGALLMRIWASPLMPEFISSLPIDGVDGTMHKRFRDGPLTGRMHIKTGLIDNVRTMAGFVLARSGRTYVVVSLQNYPNIHGGRGTDIQNALLRWVAGH